MNSLEVIHWKLVQKRTQIRHDKLILRWLQRCWRATTSCGRALTSMDRDGYESVYRKLLAAMTIAWDDAIFRTVVDEMWHHDARAFAELDVDRFSCSVFAFAEMWVESLDVVEYARVLEVTHRILSPLGDEHAIRRSNPTLLTAFRDALRQEYQLDAADLSIGKSPMFNPERYVQTFGKTVPDAVVSMVASTGGKPPRRRSGKELPSSARLDAKLVAHRRPRSSLLMVRTIDPTPGDSNITSRKLEIYRLRPQSTTQRSPCTHTS